MSVGKPKRIEDSLDDILAKYLEEHGIIYPMYALRCIGPFTVHEIDTLINVTKAMRRELDERDKDDQGVTISDTGNDPVEAPNHYTKGGLELFEVFEAKLEEREVIGGYKQQILQYIFRAPYKGTELQDYKKAAKFLERMIAYMEEKNDG